VDQLAVPVTKDFVAAVRNAGDIVRLVSDYVPLKPAGSRLKGLCPFHHEKTPSFSVDPQMQLFYCFGCQAGGDAFKFVMLYEKTDFPESVEFLAKR
jgi:DNA primase